ncbi:MAG: ribulose-phosphate 3-epimerase [Planctomycetes bacterium]|nr:ribulose-phosphate 3-epimerase [Planctomycetota bacterium]
MKRSDLVRLPEAGSIQIAPSILSANFARLAEEINVVEAAGLSIVHLDIMDGHFVSNITIGPPVVASIRTCTDLVLDCHLMISDPQRYIPDFVSAGADHITFHVEATDCPGDLIAMIHEAGLTAGVSIRPDTAASALKAWVQDCEMILVMTVQPGFGGQALIPETLEKAAAVRSMVGPEKRIQVDGGIDETTAPLATAQGVDTLVAGSAIFGKSDRAAAIAAIQNAAG